VIRLESWGLPVDPTELVVATLPTLKPKRLLTDRELRVLWHPQEQHGYRDIIRFQAPIPEEERGSLVFPSGYRAAAHADGLVIASPKIGARRWKTTLQGLEFGPQPAPLAPTTEI
jgi:hypothetical protein